MLGSARSRVVRVRWSHGVFLSIARTHKKVWKCALEQLLCGLNVCSTGIAPHCSDCPIGPAPPRTERGPIYSGPLIRTIGITVKSFVGKFPRGSTPVGRRQRAARHAKRLISHALVPNLCARRVLRDSPLGGRVRRAAPRAEKHGAKSIGGSTPRSLGR